MNAFQRLLLIRFLREEKIVFAIRRYVTVISRIINSTSSRASSSGVGGGSGSSGGVRVGAAVDDPALEAQQVPDVHGPPEGYLVHLSQTCTHARHADIFGRKILDICNQTKPNALSVTAHP